VAVFPQPERSLAVFLALITGALCLFAALAVANTQNLVGLALTLGLLTVIICFNWPEAGLYILLFSMLLGPEIIVGSLGGGATAGRGITLRLDDFLLMVIVFSWFARGAVHKELGLFLSTPLNRPIGVYMLAAAISTAVGMLFDRVRPLVGFFFVLKFVEYVFVYFAVVNYIHNKQQIRRFVTVAFITAILVALVASAQIPSGLRVSAPFEGQSGEPNTLGGYLLFLLAILGGLLVSSTRLRTAMKYALIIVVLGTPFIYTLSRASYLGMLIAAPTIILLSRRKAIASFAVLSFFLLLLLISPSAFVSRVEYTLGGQEEVSGQLVVGGLRLDTSTSARLMTYQNVLSDFPKHPLLGYGITGYGFIDGQYPRVLIEMGLLGFVAFLWLLYILARQGWRTLRVAEGDWERGLCIGYLAGLVGLAFHALGSNTFIIVRIMEPFWFFTGIVTLLYLFNTGEQLESKPEESPYSSVSQGLIRPTVDRM